MHLADPAPCSTLRALAGALALVPNLALAAPEVPRTSEPDAVFEIVGPGEAPRETDADEAQPADDEAADDEAADDEAADDDAADDDAADDDAADESAAEADEPEPSEPEPSTTPIRPPRVDGPYFGGVLFGGASFAKVLAFDLSGPLLGGGAFLQAGDAVLKWLSLGIAVGGQAGVSGNRRLAEGALLVEVAFIPMQRYPLSIRTGFGFGGGRVFDRQTGERPGFGGALFKGTLRYEFFPLAAKKRPDRGGGWAIGPELGWLGATPAAAGQPFVHTILLGVSTSIYFGS